MKKQTIVLGMFLFLVSIGILGNAVNSNNYKDLQNPKISDFENISIGDTWTYENLNETEDYSYLSVEVTSISATDVMGNIYIDGNFSIEYSILYSYIYSNATMDVFLASYPESTATYGGQTLTVCDTGTIIFDVNTGIVLSIEDQIELYSWELYDADNGDDNGDNSGDDNGDNSGDDSGDGNTIPGYGLVSLISIAAISVIICILYDKKQKN